MKIIKELTLERFIPWSGAIETLERVKEEGKLDQLESTLEDLYPDGMTETALNDLLWFEEELVFDLLEIEDEEPEDED